MPAQNTVNSTPEIAPRSASSHRSLKSILARHPLISFFVLAYVLAWLAWSPWYLSEAGIGLLHYDGGNISLYVNVVALIVGPTLSAFIVTRASEGREGVRSLLRRIVLWRVGFRWYLFVLLGIPAIMLVSAVVMPGALLSFNASAVPSTLVLYVVAGLFFLFAGGPVFEEIGWRGFALPRLQQLHGPLIGSLILGTLWALWHLPLFLIPKWDTPHSSLLDVALFIVWCVALTIVFVWVINNTQGSVLLTILAHGSVNMSGAAAYDLFPTPSVTGSITGFVIGFAVVAALIVVLTRGRLGYGERRLSTPR